MATHTIMIPDEMEPVILAEAVKLGLTADEYLQAEADRRITQILNTFVSDNKGFTEAQVIELNRRYAEVRYNYISAFKEEPE